MCNNCGRYYILSLFYVFWRFCAKWIDYNVFFQTPWFFRKSARIRVKKLSFFLQSDTLLFWVIISIISGTPPCVIKSILTPMNIIFWGLFKLSEFISIYPKTIRSWSYTYLSSHFDGSCSNVPAPRAVPMKSDYVWALWGK